MPRPPASRSNDGLQNARKLRRVSGATFTGRRVLEENAPAWRGLLEAIAPPLANAQTALRRFLDAGSGERLDVEAQPRRPGNSVDRLSLAANAAREQLPGSVVLGVADAADERLILECDRVAAVLRACGVRGGRLEE